MIFKKILSAAMALAVAGSLAATASAELVVVENPEQGLSSSTTSWLAQVYNVGNEAENKPATKYDIDYSKVAKYSVTFTVLEEDRIFWDGQVGGSLVLSINGGDIPIHVTDENGNPVYETDENGNIVYRTQLAKDENGNYIKDENGEYIKEFVLDENGEKIPVIKTHPLMAKYNWPNQEWWGINDADLGLDTSADDKPVKAEKVGEYTYKVTSNVYENPLANGDAKEIGCMQIQFAEWSGNLCRLEVTNVDVMDSSDNVLLSFDGNGKASVENTEEVGALEVVDDPELPLVVSTRGNWFVAGYENAKCGDDNYPAVSFDIDCSKVAKLSATLTVVEEDRDIFDGRCAGGLALNVIGDEINYMNKPMMDKYYWPLQTWWGVNDEALGINEVATEGQDLMSEKVGDYTYKITSNLFDNPLANGDTKSIDHMVFAVQEWGYNKAKMRVVQLDVMDSSGNVLISFDGNGKGTIPSEPDTGDDTSEPESSEPETSEPETSEPETSEPETSEPETSEPETSKPDDTSSAPESSDTSEEAVEFVPEPIVDETVDKETAQVIAEIKVSAPDVAFEAGTKLTVKKDDSVDDENAFALDITFTLNGNSVQPKDGTTVTVSVPVPPKFKDVNEDMLKVFHFLNGKYTRVEATVKDGKVTFDTTHFSTYVISPDNLEEKNPPESSTATPSTPETPNPSTGVAAVSVLPIAVTVGAATIILRKKK